MRGTAKAVEGPHDPAGGCLTTRTTQKFHSSSGLRAVARHKKTHFAAFESFFFLGLCRLTTPGVARTKHPKLGRESPST